MAQFIPCGVCQETVNRFLEVCPYCGQDPGGDRSDVPLPPVPIDFDTPRGTFRPLESVALFAQLLFGLFTLGSVISLIAGVSYRSGLLDLAAGRAVSIDDVILAEERYLAAIGVVSVGYVILSIVFVTWFWRAYSNLGALGRIRARGTGWAIGAWFIPLAGLVIPYGIGAEIWTQSKPEPGGVTVRRDPNMEPVISWWALFVIMSLINQAGLFVGGDDQDATELAAFVGIDMVASVVSIAAAVAAVRFIRLATARQQDLHQLVGVSATDGSD